MTLTKKQCESFLDTKITLDITFPLLKPGLGFSFVLKEDVNLKFLWSRSGDNDVENGQWEDQDEGAVGGASVRAGGANGNRNMPTSSQSRTSSKRSRCGHLPYQDSKINFKKPK